MSVTRIELSASATQTASGNTGSQPIPTLTMAQIELDITAAVAVTTFDLWLQGSSDNLSWYDLVADLVLKTADSGTAGTVVANPRDICEAKSTTTAEKFIGVFKHLPAKHVRGKWALNGTSVTFSLALVGK